ncbi:sigma-70 family RNA polymerase sigma factor [bacterium]|nr:sigma-70 family RNA polymerase sigma factor [bacterium]
MQSKNSYDGIPEYAIELIRFRAAEMVRNGEFNEEELEELEQELVLYLLEHLKDFDEKRSGLNTYIARILWNYSTTLIRRRRTQKKYFPSQFEWDLRIPSNKYVTYGDLYSDEMLRLRSECDQLSEWERLEKQIDLEAAMEGLTKKQKVICGALQEGTVFEAAMALGVDRTTIKRNVVLIREHFESQGMKKGE